MANRPYGSPTDFNLLKLALGEKDANESMPGRVPSGIAENAYFNSIPNTAEQQRESNDYATIDEAANDRYSAQQEANTMGYASPGAAREDEYHKKLTLAGEPSRVQGEANIKAAGSRSEAQLAAIQALLAGGGGDRSVSVSGVGSIGAAPHATASHGPAAAVMNKVISARQAMQDAEPNGIMKTLGFSNKKKGAYDAALANALQSFPPQARQDAQTLVGKYGKLAPSELLQHARQEFPDLDPSEEDTLYNVLSLTTGQP